MTFQPERLNGYLSATEVAALFDVSRQAIHKKIKLGEFKTARTIGGIYIIREAEAKKAADKREQAWVDRIAYHNGVSPAY